MALSPQLPPTDFAALESVEDRGQREALYADNAIAEHKTPSGIRYSKGTDASAEKRSWQSLDVVLRSDENASAAIPRRQMRLSRVFTALTMVAAIVTVAGAAASAREGLDLGELNGTGGLLLGGGLATVGFGVAAGVFYGRTKRGYQDAVKVYNDSLGLRLGIADHKGDYIPPRGVLVDKDGFIVLEERERALAPSGPVTAAPPPEDPGRVYVGRIEQFADRACACEDVQCTTTVANELEAWAREHTAEAKAVSEAGAQTLREATGRMMQCVTSLVEAGDPKADPAAAAPGEPVEDLSEPEPDRGATEPSGEPSSVPEPPARRAPGSAQAPGSVSGGVASVRLRPR